jgi:hypothetical protein
VASSPMSADIVPLAERFQKILQCTGSHVLQLNGTQQQRKAKQSREKQKINFIIVK